MKDEDNKTQAKGHLHPLTHVMHESAKIFADLGFSLGSSPEAETAEYNFDKLNVPDEHPSRDLWDTFWLRDGRLLRTHTTPSDVHFLEKYGAPASLITIGKCYRYEATDATHETEFYQIDGLMIGEDISLAHLKGTLEHYFSRIFGGERRVRMRPSFFPFVEPGVEIDISCYMCEQKDAECSLCKGYGWIEIMGAGMLHPNVLKASGVDETKYQGWAFGGGVDRIAMLKYGIPDIRHIHSGDLRVVNQF